MLKKLIAAIKKPFHAGAAPVEPVKPSTKHAHSFSCPCEPCVAHTDQLTKDRLRRQGARS